IQELLAFFKSCEVSVSNDKVHFASPTLPALGLQLTSNGWAISNEKLDEMRVLLQELPTTRESLRTVLGLLQYCRSSFDYKAGPSEFSSIVSRVSTVLAGRGKLVWTTEAKNAYRLLCDRFQQRFLSFLDIRELNAEVKFVVQVDASNQAIGYVLWYLPVGMSVSVDSLVHAGRMLHWGCRKLTSAESVWPSWDREGFAIYIALTTYYRWLVGGPNVITILSDNTGCLAKWNATSANRLPMSTQKGLRWARWQMDLSGLLHYKNIVFAHVRGEENGVADALSRITESLFGRCSASTQASFQTFVTHQPSPAVDSCDDGDLNDDPTTVQEYMGGWLTPDLAGPIQRACRLAQPQDHKTTYLGKSVASIYEKVNSGEDDWPWLSRFHLFDDCLMMKAVAPVTYKPLWLTVVPHGNIMAPMLDGQSIETPIRDYLMWLAHSRRGSGHPSASMMRAQLRTKVWWPAMEQDCAQWRQTCPSCQREHAKADRNLGYYSVRRLPDRFHCVAVDFTGPYMLSTQGSYRYCLSMLDVATGY
ncbi:hypothetical protein FOL47_002933, partial [Perkinsus chesapeaki]